MPDLPNRTQYEQRLASTVADVLARQRQQAESLPASSVALPWEAFGKQLRTDPNITAALTEPFSVAALGLTGKFNVGVGRDAIDQRAERWARDWQSVLAVGVIDTGRDVMKRLGDAPDLGEKAAAFDRLFGVNRANIIGVTETTRAVSWGEVAAAGLVEAAISMRLEPEWEAEGDGSTCAECNRLDGEGRSTWWPKYPFGPPGPHSGCRCRFRWKIRGPIGAKG